MTRFFSLAQRFSLAAIVFIAVIAAPRELLLEVTDQPNIPLDFRAIMISRPDYPLLFLLLITGLRLVFDSTYPARIGATARLIWIRYGGVFWLALSIWMGTSLLWAGQPIMTRYVALHALAALIMALILADLIRAEGDDWLLSALVISGVIQTVVAVAQSITGGPLGLAALGEAQRFTYDPENFYRATGLSQHANYLGGYLAIAIFACILLSYRIAQRQQRPILPVVAGIICGIGLTTTLSRSAILGLAVGCLPLIWLILRRASPALRRLMVVGGVAAVVGGIILVLIATRGDLATRFFSGREFFFEDSWAEISASPLIGTGAGNLMLNIGPKRGYEVPNLLPVHNVYLYVWAESGLVGLALFVAGCAAILARLRSVNRQALIWSCAFVAVCVIMLFDNYWWGVHPFQLLFLWVIGMWWGLATSPTSARTQ
ncbi:MAG: O-antigen ligase family protein [Anaerolineae bacterium]|nr:O-antigen ligase family protein [Anaerolineae bacterium]